VSRYYSRAAYNSYGRTPDGASRPTTLDAESGDRSPRGFGYVNTGTKRGSGTGIEQGGADANKFFQAGAETNTSQTKQAYDSYMGMRKSKLFEEDGNAPVDENRQNRQQARLRLKGEIF